jgi:MFS superfamily sulfate permease-like transporter
MTEPHIPTIKESVKNDLAASVIVFLVALPLCLGIALASNAPITGGIIAGIIGGLVIGLLSGSPLSVSGPAAGLVVLSVDSIKTLGSYEAFLVAVAIAGALQILFGFFKLGILGEYVPTPVIKGMLAGIGVVIILKEIPHALGRDRDFLGDLEFNQSVDHENSFTAIISAFQSLNFTAVIISVISLLILFFYDSLVSSKSKIKTALPAPVIVVVLGVILAQAFAIFFPEFALQAGGHHFVELPTILESGALYQLPVPNFNALLHPKLFPIAITIAVVASLESLLSLEAVDKIDPYRRISPPNRELKVQGLGNLLSGLCGGLPVTSVIVRSSANVYAGARTRLSTICHSLILLTTVLLVPGILRLIPLSALAAILIHVGYKLAPVKLFREKYNSGWDQFLPFSTTVVGIIFTDLLTGVLIGLTVGTFYVLKLNHHNALTFVQEGTDYLIRFNKDVSFINKMELKEALKRIPDSVSVVVDGTRSMYVDRDIYEVLSDFERNCKHRGIKLQLRNVEGKALSLRRKKKVTDG